MKRFAGITLLAVVIFFAIGFTFAGTTRLWVFTGFWIIYLTVLGLGVGFIQLEMYCRAICRGRRSGSRVALTFDDGPDPDSTPGLLDLLKREKITAAFFCIGERVTAHPQIAARIVAEGHLIGNHTYHHYWYTAMLGPKKLAREIARTQETILQATGVTPVFMRPPIGMTNPHYASILHRLGLTMIGWDVRSLDTRCSPGETVSRVLRQTTAGSIILLHDGGIGPTKVIEIVSQTIEGLRAQGFEFERLDRLIGNSDPETSEPAQTSTPVL